MDFALRYIPPPAPPATGRAVGRPATAKLDRQLIIELRRLTGCGARSMTRALARVKDKGALRYLADPSETSLKRAFDEGGLSELRRPTLSLRDLPGWCAVHVVPVIVNAREPWDMVLLWEPFSGAMFGDIRTTLDGTLEDFGDFVIASLRKLPKPLVERIHEVRLTKPMSNGGFEHWYADDRRENIIQPNETAARLAAQGRGGRRSIFVEDEMTSMWGPIDLRRHMQGAQLGKHAKHLLRLALDAHNLASRDERYSGSEPPWVERAWCANGGPLFDANWSQKQAHLLCPQDRLTLALRRYTSQRGGVWPESKEIALKMNYRSKDPSAKRFYPEHPWMVPG